MALCLMCSEPAVARMAHPEKAPTFRTEAYPPLRSCVRLAAPAARAPRAPALPSNRGGDGPPAASGEAT
eukprot:12822691-Alexandrium_andersonii.AAC.1